MNEISKIGGARIGKMNATFPFASLNVNSNGLFLNVLIFGNYQFPFNKIIKIEKVGWLPFLGWGIRIYHTIEDYPSKIIFWCFSNPINLKSEIDSIAAFKPEEEKTIFEKLEETSEIEKRKNNDRLPIKTKYKVLGVIIWNLLFVIDIAVYMLPKNKFPGPFILIALLGALTVFCLLKFNKAFREKILIDSNSYKKIEGFINLSLLVLSFLSIGFLFAFISQL